MCIRDSLDEAPGNTEKKSGETGKITFQGMTKMISDIFIPIIPVLLATGILMGVRSLLVNGFGIAFSAEFDSIYTILTDTAYTFIPVLVAWSACKKFGGSPILGIVLGLMLVSCLLYTSGAGLPCAAGGVLRGGDFRGVPGRVPAGKPEADA